MDVLQETDKMLEPLNNTAIRGILGKDFIFSV